MSSKALMVTVGVVLLVLTLVAIGTGADMRLIASDALGAIVAGGLALLVGRGDKLASVRPAIVAVTVLVMAILAVTAHHSSHWLVALTLAATFAFCFVSLSTRSRPVEGGPVRPTGPPRHA